MGAEVVGECYGKGRKKGETMSDNQKREDLTRKIEETENQLHSAEREQSGWSRSKYKTTMNLVALRMLVTNLRSTLTKLKEESRNLESQN